MIKIEKTKNRTEMHVEGNQGDIIFEAIAIVVSIIDNVAKRKNHTFAEEMETFKDACIEAEKIGIEKAMGCEEQGADIKDDIAKLEKILELSKAILGEDSDIYKDMQSDHEALLKLLDEK